MERETFIGRWLSVMRNRQYVNKELHPTYSISEQKCA